MTAPARDTVLPVWTPSFLEEPWLIDPDPKHRGRLGPAHLNPACLALRSPERWKNQTAIRGAEEKRELLRGKGRHSHLPPNPPLLPKAITSPGQEKGRGWLQAGQSRISTWPKKSWARLPLLKVPTTYMRPVET